MTREDQLIESLHRLVLTEELRRLEDYLKPYHGSYRLIDGHRVPNTGPERLELRRSAIMAELGFLA